MKDKPEMTVAELGEVRMYHDCVICDNAVLVIARHKTKMPKDGSRFFGVCDECRKKYLEEGILIFNPDTAVLVVIKEEAFERCFDVPVPEGRIIFAPEEVLLLLQPTEEEDGND